MNPGIGMNEWNGGKRVSWSLTSLFSTNMAISETRGKREFQIVLAAVWSKWEPK